MDEELIKRVETLEAEVRENRQRIKNSKAIVALLAFVFPIIQDKVSAAELIPIAIAAIISVGVIGWEDVLGLIKR